jgi:hypothetical protein
VWEKAQHAAAPGADKHGYKTIGEIMTALNPFTGEFYRETLQMSRMTREMFCLMEGRHVHPSTLYPGGIGTAATVQVFTDFAVRLAKYAEFMKKVVPLHDDLFDFFYDALPGYEKVYRGREIRMRDSKGLRDLHALLARPGTAVAALDLAAAPGARRAGAPAGPDVLHPPSDTGEVIDAQARAAYRQRLRELDEAAAEADAAVDIERSARIAAERDALVAALTEAYGLGGRVRRSGSVAERARTAVTARIRDAIRRISEAHPELGRHLARSVRTGTFCVYEPDQPVRWSL